MYRATTPAHVFELPETVADHYKEVQITYKQNDSELIKHYQDGITPPGMTIDGKTVTVRLTQEETLKFKAHSSASVQVRVLDTLDNVMASEKMKLNIKSVLNEEKLE